MRSSLIACIFGLMVYGCANAGEILTDLSKGQTGWLSFQSSQEPVQLVGRLELPDKASGKVPAMIIAHASGGLDQRSERWASFLRANGIATFVLDYFGPRGITADSTKQPTPTMDVIDSLQLLTTHPQIDLARIGVIGFSRGADMALESANIRASGAALAAHVALYPVCTFARLARGGSGAPILLLSAGKDDLVPSVHCEVLAERGKDNGRDVTFKLYENACHGWDGDVNISWFHRAANRTYTMCTDAQVTKQSQEDVLAFLKTAFRF